MDSNKATMAHLEDGQRSSEKHNIEAEDGGPYQLQHVNTVENKVRIQCV